MFARLTQTSLTIAVARQQTFKVGASSLTRDLAGYRARKFQSKLWQWKLENSIIWWMLKLRFLLLQGWPDCLATFVYLITYSVSSLACRFVGYAKPYCCNQCLLTAAMTVIILSMESRAEEHFLSVTASLFIDTILQLLNPHKLIINLCLRIQTVLSDFSQSQQIPTTSTVEERRHEAYIVLSFRDKNVSYLFCMNFTCLVCSN
jgi:hypothetical protein